MVSKDDERSGSEVWEVRWSRGEKARGDCERGDGLRGDKEMGRQGDGEKRIIFSVVS